MAPDRQIQTDLTGLGSDLPSVSLQTEPTGVESRSHIEEFSEPKGLLPFLLIAGGIAIYFIAIAAFASFPGVAIGMAVMVLGGIVYSCRGLGRQISLPTAAPDDRGSFEETHTAQPRTFDYQEDIQLAPFETPEELHVTTRPNSVSV